MDILLSDPAQIEACPADRAALASLVGRLNKPVCLEVGGFAGQTAVTMADAGASRVYSVDPWLSHPVSNGQWASGPEMGAIVFGRYLRTAGGRIYQTIFPLPGLSLHWAQLWAALPLLDLVFLDGMHDAKSVAADIAAWTPRLCPGGILCGHDLCAAFPGVEQAVRASGPFERIGSSIWFRQIAETPTAEK